MRKYILGLVATSLFLAPLSTVSAYGGGFGNGIPIIFGRYTDGHGHVLSASEAEARAVRQALWQKLFSLEVTLIRLHNPKFQPFIVKLRNIRTNINIE